VDLFCRHNSYRGRGNFKSSSTGNNWVKLLSRSLQVGREKRACRRCDRGTVTMPELAPRIVEKGLASDRVVIQTVIAKYCDHLPLYRQSARGAAHWRANLNEQFYLSEYVSVRRVA
jgi:hypothetical protein